MNFNHLLLEAIHFWGTNKRFNMNNDNNPYSNLYFSLDDFGVVFPKTKKFLDWPIEEIRPVVTAKPDLKPIKEEDDEDMTGVFMGIILLLISQFRLYN